MSTCTGITSKKYAQNQETHHKKETFSDELKGFLKQHNVDYDEKYLD